MGILIGVPLSVARVIFLPTLIALGWGRLSKRHVVAIALANVLLGWTLIGWMVALAWACADSEQDAPRPEASANLGNLGYSPMPRPSVEKN
ncbi:MAG: superinfection immunity protein [Dehalococcoidia bacterium]|nr:superinfection immunity protein [Dehalococcoidia bacterium]